MSKFVVRKSEIIPIWLCHQKFCRGTKILYYIHQPPLLLPSLSLRGRSGFETTVALSMYCVKVLAGIPRAESLILWFPSLICHNSQPTLLFPSPLAVDFFNQINMLYGTITEKCTNESCPTMHAGPKWVCEGRVEKLFVEWGEHQPRLAPQVAYYRRSGKFRC